MSDFTHLVDLASERIGGRVIAANDEFFASKKNLLKAAKPIFIEGKYTGRGKWMDGWETRRRRTPGHDWCIVQLGAPGVVRGVVVDTSYFRGNFPESCSIEACMADGPSSNDPLSSDAQWTEILTRSTLKGDSHNPFQIDHARRWTHLRLHIYPDGGVARFHVFGEAVPYWRKILTDRKSVNLAALEHGAEIIDCSDKFFSAPQNLLMPGKSTHMGDGWETRRRRGPGYDWVIIKLGIAGTIEEIEADTSHFKGNYPESCSLEACNAEAGKTIAEASWREMLARTRLKPNNVRRFRVEGRAETTHVRFNIFPDGGIARLRINGSPTPNGTNSAMLRWLNALPDVAASEALMSCCGSKKWAEQLQLQRPFTSSQHLLQLGNRCCDELSEQDWLEAFSHHPQIGGRKTAGSLQAQRWATQEQSRAHSAPAQILNALKKANQEYYSRFGHIFIVCAAGKSAEEILSLVKQRLKNDVKRELQIASAEQRKITQLRLEKMLSL